MSDDWRFKMQHAGDMFVGMLEATILAAKRSAADLVIDCQVQGLGRKKNKVAARIGNRVIEMRENDPDLLADDPQISLCYEDLDHLQAQIAKCNEEKQDMKERWDSLMQRLASNYVLDSDTINCSKLE